MLFMVALGLSAFSASAQTIFEKGLHAEIQAGTLVQKYPYGTLSGVVGHTNDNGFFWGFGAKSELPLATDPALEVFPHEIPGPYSGEKFIGVFFELKKLLIDSHTALFADIKVGPANRWSTRGMNIFAIPSIGLSRGRLSLMLGAELGVGAYSEGTDYGYTLPDGFGPCEAYLNYYALPSIAIAIAF